MTRAELKRQIEELLAAGDQRIRAGFLQSVAEIVNEATLAQIIRALDRGNIEAAIDAVGVERAAFRALEDAVSSTYSAGGVHAAKTLPPLRDSNGARLVVRFDVRNERAEEWLRDHSSNLVTDIVEDQRTAIRSALTDGMMAGQNPRSTALDVVGRITGNSRSGGIVGLTSQQERTVAWVRQALADGDVDALRRYLTLSRRDKRFDRSIGKVIDGAKKLSADDIAKITGRLSDSYLQLRGEMIGRTESLASLNASRTETFRQAAEKGGTDTRFITREWSSAGDSRVRHSHAAMDGQKVQGLDAPFVSPNGYRMMHPGDSSLGAPGSEIINCRCATILRVDYFEGRG